MNQDLFDNCIIIKGLVYTLTKQDNNGEKGWKNNPCEICELRDICKQQKGLLCSYLDASLEEYFIQNAYIFHRETIDSHQDYYELHKF